MSLGQRETYFKMKTVRSVAQNELKKLAFNFSFLFVVQFVPMSHPEAVTFVQITSPQFCDDSVCQLQTKFN